MGSCELEIVRNGNELALAEYVPVQEEVLPSDVTIPRVLLMQALSELVVDRLAHAGDIVRSTTKEKLGDDKTKIKIIPLTYKLTWVNMEEVGQKYEFRGEEPRSIQNDNLPFEYMKEDGTKWKRVRNMNLFALLEKDVLDDAALMQSGELPDINKVLLPVVISLRGTSYPAARDVANFFMRVKDLQRRAKVMPFMYSLELGCNLVKGEKGSYFVFTIGSNATPAPKEAHNAASYWYGVISKSLASLKVDAETDVSVAERHSTDEIEF